MKIVNDFFKPVDNNTVLVAYDLGDDTREDFRTYLTENVGAEYRADSTYEFNKEETNEKWNNILKKMEASITEEGDIIWVWEYVDSQLKVRVFD